MIERLAPSPEAAAVADRQFRQFRALEGPFGGASAQSNAREMPAWQWWQQYGYKTPELRNIAMRILAQVASATASERNWSAMGFVHSATRNRLSVEKCNDLTYCYCTLRLRDKILAEDYEEDFLDWE